MRPLPFVMLLLACNGSSSPPPPPPPPRPVVVPVALRDIASISVARYQGYGKKPACSPLDSITVSLASLSWTAMTCKHDTGEKSSREGMLTQAALDAIARAVATLPAEGVCDSDAGQQIITVMPSTGPERAYGPCFGASPETKPMVDALHGAARPALTP